jgi:hypothetical protein
MPLAGSYFFLKRKDGMTPNELTPFAIFKPVSTTLPSQKPDAPMNINTKTGELLIATLGRYTSKTEKIIFFKTRAGSLVSSYYVSTFNSIKEGDGLMLSNSCDSDQVLDADQVAKCKTFIRNHS